MSFTTTLSKAVSSAGAVYVNGFQTDSNMIKRFDSAGRDFLEIDLRSCGQGVLAAPADQKVVIDEHGDAFFDGDDGRKVQLSFQVAAPLTADLVAQAG